MNIRTQRYFTQWAAQFAVASELCKRRYQVALTLGNQPVIDLMAVSPGGQNFVIDVKGLYKKNFWDVRAQPPQNALFYIFAYVPEEEPNRFFILTQAQVNTEIVRLVEAARMRARARGETNNKDLRTGIQWGFAQSYENRWEQLPQ